MNKKRTTNKALNVYGSHLVSTTFIQSPEPYYDQPITNDKIL